MLKNPPETGVKNQATSSQDSLAPMREFFINNGKKYPSEEYYNKKVKPRETLAAKFVEKSLSNCSPSDNLVPVFVCGNEAFTKPYRHHAFPLITRGEIWTALSTNTTFRMSYMPMDEFERITSVLYRSAAIMVIFAENQDNFMKLKTKLELGNYELVESSVIMIVAKPSEVEIDTADFPISGTINLTQELTDKDKFAQEMLEVLSNIAGLHAKLDAHLQYTHANYPAKTIVVEEAQSEQCRIM